MVGELGGVYRREAMSEHLEECRACRELQGFWEALTAGIVRQGRLPVGDPRRWKDVKDRRRYAKAAAIRKARKERKERKEQADGGKGDERMRPRGTLRLLR